MIANQIKNMTADLHSTKAGFSRFIRSKNRASFFSFQKNRILHKVFIVSVAASTVFGFVDVVNAVESTRADYVTAKAQAHELYKDARAQCASLSGIPKKVCVKEAKLEQVRSTAQAEAAYKNTSKARANAHLEIAEAEYELAIAKCALQSGDDKDICVKQAKAVKTAEIAQAKVGR